MKPIRGRWDLKPKNLPEPLPVLAGAAEELDVRSIRDGSTTRESTKAGNIRPTPVAARVLPLFVV